MSYLSDDLIWWITIIDLPAMGTLFWLIWRNKNEADRALNHMRELLDARHSQLREALAAFKLEAAKSYASISDLRALEARITDHLLRIEHKLDQTAMKTESLSAANHQKS